MAASGGSIVEGGGKRKVPGRFQTSGATAGIAVDVRISDFVFLS